MKAVVLRQFVDHLTADNVKNALMIVNDWPLPIIKNDEVLVRVHAASINPVDYKVSQGSLALVLRRPPWVPGFDLAGVVEAVGASCHRIKVGDPVYAMAHFRCQGAFAQLTAIQEKHVALKPPSLTFAEAASVPLVGLTSYQSLMQYGHFQAKQRVLILAASGGTGSFAVQLAKQLGASHIAATCGARNFDLVRSLGAHTVIDYRTQNWWEELKGQEFDLVYDCVGGHDVWEHAQLVLKPKGSFVSIAGDTPEVKLGIPKLLKTGLGMANRKFWSFFGYPSYSFVTCDAARYQELDYFTELFKHNALRPVVERVYPMEQVHDFYMHSASGRVTGKICLAITDKANAKA